MNDTSRRLSFFVKDSDDSAQLQPVRTNCSQNGGPDGVMQVPPPNGHYRVPITGGFLRVRQNGKNSASAKRRSVSCPHIIENADFMRKLKLSDFESLVNESNRNRRKTLQEEQLLASKGKCSKRHSLMENPCANYEKILHNFDSQRGVQQIFDNGFACACNKRDLPSNSDYHPVASINDEKLNRMKNYSMNAPKTPRNETTNDFMRTESPSNEEKIDHVELEAAPVHGRSSPRHHRRKPSCCLKLKESVDLAVDNEAQAAPSNFESG